VTDNNGYLWLKQWLFYSLRQQLPGQGSGYEQLQLLSQLQPAQHFIIGISGSQGSGKSTLAAALQQLWLEQGVLSDVISLDDYYLAPELRLERASLWHPLFAERGVPGTHDTALLLTQLQAFKSAQAQSWRRYDKGQDKVAGCLAKTDARLLILEGWCVGVAAQTEAQVLLNPNLLEQQQDPDALWRRKVNQVLKDEYQQIWQLVDNLVWLNAPDWDAVCRWRSWQERPLQQQGLGKSPAELQHFMSYFERLTREGWRQLPDLADFILTLDQEHNLQKLTPDE